MKHCLKCNEEKSLYQFSKHNRYPDGLQRECKQCCNLLMKIWRDKNSKKQSQDKKEWYQKNAEKTKTRVRARYVVKAKSINAALKVRYHNDIKYRLRHNLRTRLKQALIGNYKSGSAVTDLGCSIDEFKLYLQSKFQLGMTWDNYGEWHIDHVKPLVSFNLSNSEEFKIACHYTNLQPLWAIDNIKKRDSYDE